jgi:hypothetical protein
VYLYTGGADMDDSCPDQSFQIVRIQFYQNVLFPLFTPKKFCSKIACETYLSLNIQHVQ